MTPENLRKEACDLRRYRGYESWLYSPVVRLGHGCNAGGTGSLY